MKHSNLLFLLYLICSISFSSQMKLKEQQEPKEYYQRLEKSNIYLGASGRIQEFTIGDHELLGEETSLPVDPVFTYDYLAKAGDRITITVRDMKKVKGIALFIKYLDSNGKIQEYTTNDIDWVCNDQIAVATGTIGNNGKWGDFIAYLFGIPSIWSKENEEYATCSATIPLDPKYTWETFEYKRYLLTDNIKIYGDKLEGLKINDKNLVGPTENEQGKVKKFSYDIQEGDTIQVTLSAIEGNEPGFGAYIEYLNPLGSKETITTKDKWICDGILPVNKGTIGKSNYPVDDKNLKGVKAIWGASPTETTCEFYIPKKTKIEEEEKPLQPEENHEENIIMSVDDTLTELRINNVNYVERLEADKKIKKLYIPLKEGDEISVTINNQFGGYKGFAGIFKYTNLQGTEETLKTNGINWMCDGMKPKVIETIGEGTFFNEWSSELGGVKTIWGKNMHRETTCTAKLQNTKGGLIIGGDPSLKGIEINGKQIDISDELAYKDYSDLKIIETNVNYGDQISFMFPKGEYVFAAKIVSYLDGKPKIFYTSKYDWVCKGVDVNYDGIIGEGTPYDKNWKSLETAYLLHVKSKKEIKCSTVLVEKISNVYIGTTGKVKEIKLNDMVADLSLVENIDDPNKVKKLNAMLNDEDTISITVEKSDPNAKDYISAMIMLNLGGANYHKFPTNEYYWDCTDVKKPYNFGKTDESDPAEWQEFLKDSTKIFGSETATEVTCKTKLSMRKSSITVAGSDGMKAFFVNEKLVEEKSEYLEEDNTAIKEFEYLLEIGDKISFATEMNNKESSLAAKINIPVKGEIIQIQTKANDWECNNIPAVSKGIVSGASETFAKWSGPLNNVEAIGYTKKDDFLLCSTTIHLYKSLITFSAKDKVEAILVNNKTIDLSGLALDDYKEIKIIDLLLNKGDEVKIIAENNEEDTWTGIIASIDFMPGSPDAKKYVTDESWICGCCYKPEIITNEDVTNYWTNKFGGAKAIWETESSLEHKNLACRTTLN